MGVTKPQLFTKAVDVFTDREEPRRAFWKLYNEMKKGDMEVIHFYGTGGIGKTTLLKKLQSELDENKVTYYMSYSFEHIKPKAEILADFARILSEKLPGIKFPVFEYAYLKYKQTSGEDVDGLREKQSQTFFEQGSMKNVMEVFSAVGGLGAFIAKSGARGSKRVAGMLRRTMGKDKDVFGTIDSYSSVEILKDLQKYFAYDAYDYFEKLEYPFVIMLDGYEGLVNKLEKGDKAVSDDLWLREEGGPLRSLPNVLWVVAGRERLDWGEDLLKQDNTHLMGNLSEADSMEFFRKSGIDDEELGKGLYELTLGTPVYMDLCIKTYKGIKARKGENYVPALQEFGHNTEELAARYLRDMSITEQNLMKLISCLPNVWNDEMVETLAVRLKIDFSHGEYRLIKELSLVESDVNAPEYYKLHETFRKVVVAQMDEDELGDIVPEVVGYLVDELYEMSGDEPEMYSRMTGALTYFRQFYDYFSLSEFGATALLESMSLLSCYIESHLSLDIMEEIKEVFWNLIEDEEIYNRQMVRWGTLMVGELHQVDKFQEALDLAKENYEQAKEVYEPNHIEILRALLAYAEECLHNKDDARTEALCTEAFEIIEANGMIYLSQQLQALEIYHTNELQAGRADKAERLAEKRIALCLEAYEQEKTENGENSPSMPYYGGHLYRAYYDAEKYEDALRIAEERLCWYKQEKDPHYVLGYYHDKNKCYSALQDYAKALEACRMWYQAACEHYGENTGYVREAKYHLARALHKTEKYEEAADFFRQIYKERAAKYGEKTWTAMYALWDLADALWMTEDDSEVEEMYQRVYQYALETDGEDDTDTQLSLSNLAWCYEYQEKYEQAYECYQKLCDSYIRVEGRESEDALWYCLRMAGILFEMKRYDEAFPVLEENIGIMRRQDEFDKLVLAENLYYAGRSMFYRKESRQALPYFEEAYSLYQQEEPDTPVVHELLYRTGLCNMMLGDNRTAIGWFEKFIECMDALGETERKDYLRAKTMLGKAYFEEGEYEESCKLFQWCYEREQEKVNERADLRNVWFYARSEYKLGNMLVADELLKHHYEFCVQTYGQEDYDTIVLLFNIGNYYEETGRLEQAREKWEQALELAQEAMPEDVELLEEIREALTGAAKNGQENDA